MSYKINSADADVRADSALRRLDYFCTGQEAVRRSLRTNPYDYSPLSDPCTKKSRCILQRDFFCIWHLADYRYAVLLLGLERRLGVAVTLVLQVLGFYAFRDQVVVNLLRTLLGQAGIHGLRTGLGIGMAFDHVNLVFRRILDLGSDDVQAEFLFRTQLGLADVEEGDAFAGQIDVIGVGIAVELVGRDRICLLYTSPSPRDA